MQTTQPSKSNSTRSAPAVAPQVHYLTADILAAIAAAGCGEPDERAEQAIALAIAGDAAREYARAARKKAATPTTTDAAPSFTLSALADMQFPATVSLPVLGHSDVIVKGFSHILTGGAKAGKTTLLVTALAEWRGETVRIFSEESTRVWDARRRAMTAEVFENDDVTIVPAIGMSFDDMLAAASACSESVVVVDTIRSLWGFTDENDNSEVARACRPWVAMQQATGKTLILGHHDRKSGGPNGTGIAGAGAFLAIVDVAVMISRDAIIKNRRKVETLGRVITSTEFLYELDGKRLRDLGHAGAVEFDEVKRRILDVLVDGMTTSQVRAKLDPKPSERQVLYALTDMATIGNRIHRNPIITDLASGKRITWYAGPIPRPHVVQVAP